MYNLSPFKSNQPFMVSGFGAGEVILDHCNLHLCNPEIWGMVVSSSEPSLTQSPPEGFAPSAGGQTGVWSLVWPVSTYHAAHTAGGRCTPAVSAAVLARHHISRLVRSDVWPIVTLMDGEL